LFNILCNVNFRAVHLSAESNQKSKFFSDMGVIKDKFKERADILSSEIKEILKENGDRVIGEVKVSRLFDSGIKRKIA
jgi:hypothetical protein